MSSEALSTARMSRFAEAVSYWAARAPDRVAVDTGSGTVTYAELERLIARAAERLDDAGLKRNDRAFVVAENTLGALAVIFAVNRIGASCSILNARMRPNEVGKIAKFADPRLIIFPEAGSATAAEHAATFGAAPIIDDPVLGRISSVASTSDPEPTPAADDPREELALVMFTSGTTGVPKGVMLTNAIVLAQARAQVTAREITPADALYLVSPLAHTIGFSSNAVSALVAGAKLIMIPKFDVGDLVDRIAAGEVTMMVSVPQLYQRMMDHAQEHGITFERSRLRVTSSGGSALDPGIKARFLEVFGGKLHNGYGATEFVPIARVPLGVDVASNVVGRPDPAVEVRLVKDDGSEATPGEAGEILARGPYCMKGYFRNPEETARVLSQDGWLATGDIGVLNDDGMLAIVGRKKEIIIRSGFNVYPTDVEAALSDHPAVNLVAVVGRKVPGNEEVVAFVTLRAGATATPAELRDFLTKSLTAYKIPSEIIILDDLPTGPTGKILKSALADSL